jgi:GDP-L-fucose synthase
MKIFVTGGGGFLGHELVKQLSADGHDVVNPTSIQCNLLDGKSLTAYSKVKYDRIFHLAAWTQAGDFCLRHPGEQWINNQLINTNVISWWHAEQPNAKLICMGTSCAYPVGMELHERDYMNGEPIDSLYTYAMTKRMLYQGIRAMGKQFQMKWLCAVPSTLYGPGYHTDGRQMHFIFDLIRKILRGKYLGEQVTLWGNGHQRRELVHVRSFVQVLLALADNVEDQLLNIGAGTDYSIREFADHICRLVDFDPGKICYDTTKYVGAESKILSITEIEKLMPDYLAKMISLEAGLKETIEWFLSEKAYLQLNERG